MRSKPITKPARISRAHRERLAERLVEEANITTRVKSSKEQRVERNKETDKLEAEFYAMVAEANPFFTVKTWEDLCAINIRFLKGEIDKTYYHLGPTDPETEPLLPALIKLNTLGFYSTNGQPGLIEEDNKRRACITGFVRDHTTAVALIDFLETVPFLDYIYTLYKPKTLSSSFPADTVSVDLTNEYHEDTKEWKIYSNMGVEWHFEDDLSDMPNVDKLLKKAGSFFICHKQYGAHESIEDTLLQFFEK